MRLLCKLILVLVFALANAEIALAHSPEPASRAPTTLGKAIEAAEKKAWGEAQKHAEKADDPLAVKIIDWLRYQDPDPQLEFATVADFIISNPEWPRMSRLRRTAEAAIDSSDEDATVADWFEHYPPITGAGALAHLDALMALGRLAQARTLVPQYWRNLDFTGDEEKAFHRKYGRQLANADHLTRLDRLIWDEQYWPARRMLPRVGGAHAALGRARLALLRREGGVDGAIARVPAALRDTPGLQYERLRWRRRKGRDTSAREILLAAPEVPGQHEQWAAERLILARRALLDGHYSEAQRLVAGHGLTRGAEFAEAEFLAGWISLTYLNEASAAYQNFTRLYDNVGYPISRARGAFWAGRAAAAMGDEEKARRWWQTAAKHPATFYGQQAIVALGDNGIRISFAAPNNAQISIARRAPELVEIVRHLAEHGHGDLTVPFLRRLTTLATTLEERFAVVDLAHQIGQPQEAIRAAKRLAQLDRVVPAPGYPFLPQEFTATSTAKQQREAPLVLALIRQESAFDPRAVSPVGARGMMQILPRTAKRMARSLGKPYSRARLIEDPRYNIELGTAYLDSMLARFDGAPALALAAYNAGPSRVNSWLHQLGDPRTEEISLIDWIESIPFGETRNYVQRVLEAETVYRELIMNEQIAAMPSPSETKEGEGSQP